eukprot:CAMPEP_0113937912 /NCGR_PEP_ID=MMETSP1339-20121228/4398_1 /TAXON_ID=94617 /ORGANISM="Fibrocapsa japonica" /LENGTH=368 /DNA_ID=CAMNT_0000940825 /DNA_START=72 /DNA_END=1174 /DNA_ORIENTATION=+ /assembly_acc=CAM_ASM_000762
MPALNFLGRRWKVAGDEFALPAMCTLMLRFFWVAMLVILTAIAFNDMDSAYCSYSWVLYTYFFVSITVFVASIVVQFAIAYFSLQGTITSGQERQGPITRFLRFQLFLWALQLLSAACGCYLVYALSDMCMGEFDSILLASGLGLIVVTQLIDLFWTSCCCLLFLGERSEGGSWSEDYQEERNAAKPRGGYTPPKVALADLEEGYHNDTGVDFEENKQQQQLQQRQRRRTMSVSRGRPMTMVEAEWRSRCDRMCRLAQCATCSLFGGMGGTEDDISMVARVMARVFSAQGHLDIVASDVAAGIALLRHLQRSHRQFWPVHPQGARDMEQAGLGSNTDSSPLVPINSSAQLEEGFSQYGALEADPGAAA